jgi:hypothetical protein
MARGPPTTKDPHEQAESAGGLFDEAKCFLANHLIHDTGKPEATSGGHGDRPRYSLFTRESV